MHVRNDANPNLTYNNYGTKKVLPFTYKCSLCRKLISTVFFISRNLITRPTTHTAKQRRRIVLDIQLRRKLHKSTCNS